MIVKRYLNLLVLTTFLGVLFSLVFFAKVHAQIDGFTYFIPFPADKLDDLFDRANFDIDFTDDDIVTTISISIRRTGTIIYYDHWEDNMESILTAPRQTSSLIWGDNNPANGIPPGFTTDLLNAGDVLALRDTVELPRDPSQHFFDGGDKLTAFGGNVAVSMAAWPESVGSLFAGSWELLNTTTWGTDYTIPIGIDLAGLRAGFGVASLNVQAVQDNTLVQLDLDGDGSFETSLTLNQGQQFTQTSNDVQTGAQVQASAPVQVHLFTGNPNPGVNYEGRAYLILPRPLWTNDYVAPRSSSGDFWLYNPHSTPLDVTATTATTVTTLTIPPQSTLQYPSGALSGPGGIRFTATDGREFNGMVALDPSEVREWGYLLLPVAYLTPQVLVGWAPGNETAGGNLNCNPPTNGFESRVYVTALTTTTLNVDYEQDGNITPVLVTPLSETPIVDPDDCDMTGAFLFTADGTPFAAVWGQDPTAPNARPSLDLGTSQVPLASMTIQKRIVLINDADGSGTITWGDAVRFEIVTINNTGFALDPALLSDVLPDTVDYISQSSTLRGGPIADDDPPQSPFPFDEGGYNIPGGLQPQEALITTFDALVKENVSEIENVACIDSPQVAEAECATIVVPVQTPRLAMSKELLVPADGLAQAGDVITFGVTLTSTGNISITKLPLQDNYDETILTFQEAQPFPPDLITPGEFTWTDLALANRFGPLPPGRAINLTVNFSVNELPPNITKWINIAEVRGAEGIDGSVLPPLTDTAEVFFLPTPTSTPTQTPSPTPTQVPTSTPTPTPTSILPSPTDDDNDEDEDKKTSTPPPQLAANPLPTIIPAPTSPFQLPVTILPETGTRSSPTGWINLIILLFLVLGLMYYRLS